MRSRWHETTIRHLLAKNGGEVKTGPFGTKLKASEYSDIGVPVVSVGEIQMGRIVVSDRTPKVDVDVTNRMPEYLLCEGDIVFGRKGAVERSAIVRAEQAGWFLGSDGIRLRITPTCNAQFLAYQFLSQAHRRWMLQHAGGTTMASLNQKIIEHIPIVLPPLPEQKVIVHILGSLDDKIELNRQMNETLEAMAQAHFKSWFIDFDLVIDNALYAGNPIPEPLHARAEARKALGYPRTSLPQGIEQQFPNNFIFAEEMGWIPEGWKPTPLDKIANYQNGLALQKFRPCNEHDFLPIVKIAQLKKGYADSEEKASSNIKAECIIDDGDIVFSWSGSLMVDIWCGGKAALNQHLFKVTSSKYPKWFFYQYTNHHLSEFQRIAADKAVTMGHIKKEHLSQALCLSPPPEFFEKCSLFLTSLVEKQIKSRIESNHLKNLRDTLLPKLLSGQLRLPDSLIEKFAEEPSSSDTEQLISEAS